MRVWQTGELKKLKFRRGTIGRTFHEEERLFILALVKLARPKTDVEKNIVRRLIVSMLGGSIQNIHLHPMKECPTCERQFRGAIYDRHVIVCRTKEKQARDFEFEVDPEVLERLR